MVEDIVPVTFLYDNIEVVKTGRIAQKAGRLGKMVVLLEITPLEELQGTWKKWIREAELYTIG